MLEERKLIVRDAGLLVLWKPDANSDVNHRRIRERISFKSQTGRLKECEDDEAWVTFEAASEQTVLVSSRLGEWSLNRTLPLDGTYEVGPGNEVIGPSGERLILAGGTAHPTTGARWRLRLEGNHPNARQSIDVDHLDTWLGRSHEAGPLERAIPVVPQGSGRVWARISARHARLWVSAGRLFVLDASTNGTWLDGMRLPSNVAIPLRSGARIRLTGELSYIVQAPLPPSEPSNS